MKKEITRLFTFLLLFTTYFASAQNQNGSIKGKVLDPEGETVPFANVVLNASADSSIIKVETTDFDGLFNMAQIPEGQYQINISYVGLQPYQSEVFVLKGKQSLDLETIQLQPSSNELNEVVVTAERPILEVKPDKLVFNVEGSINATGSTAFELLRKAPGIVIDNNDNVTMLGRSGVKIYIDGKPSPLSTEDLAAFLKTIQSDEIDAIEIITSPSSKYDAEGNAGILNIKMRKDKRMGTNANLNLGYSIGKVAQYNGTISGNYRNQKLNAFGSYSHNTGYNKNVFNLYREQVGFRFDQRNDQGGDWESHNFRAGTDFFLNEKQTIGFLVNGYKNKGYQHSSSRTAIGMVDSPVVDSFLIAENDNTNSRDNYNFNLNYRFDDSNGRVWNMDLDYGMFRNEGTSYQPNTYLDPSESEVLQKRINSTNTPTDIDIYTFKLDHERPLWEGQLSLGAKVAYVRTDNIFDFFNIENGLPHLDLDRSNQFEYTENVNAAYLNYSRQIKKFGFQVGLRLEQTNSTGDLTSQKQSENDHVSRNYLDLFPSGGITYTPSEKHSFQLSYSSRINRPSYQDLNPFENKLDELTFEQGNPFLQPEYANNLQLSHTFNYRLTTSLGYSHTRDQITRITDTSGVTGSYITWLNLEDQHNYSLSVGAPVTITEWWSTYTNMTAAYTKNKADYGDGKLVDLNAKFVNIYSQQTFKLPGNFTLEVSGWYNSPSIWGGTFEMERMWSIDAGLQKKVMDGRGTLRLSVSDIFKTNNWSGDSQFGVLYIRANGTWDSRRFGVNFSYLLGNTQVKGARKRKTGMEDESNRVKS